jgi:predicted Zn-dependent protease
VPGPALEKPDVVLSAERVLVTRGGQDAFLKDFAPAIQPYRQGDYAVAAERLARLASRYADVFEVRFYHGVSLLLQGRAAEAVAPLRQARALARGPQGTDAEWYLSLALFRAGQAPEGWDRLAGLCAGDGPRKRAACSALPR